MSELEGILAEMRDALDRIARAQEGLVAIAAEAREERLKLADKMKQHFQTGFIQEKKHEG